MTFSGYGQRIRNAGAGRHARARPRQRTARAPKPPHFAATAKRVIFLFLNGGLVAGGHLRSQADARQARRRADARAEDQDGPGLRQPDASPFAFSKYGQSGLEVSEIFPKSASASTTSASSARCTPISAITSRRCCMMNCGHSLPGRPSMGSWLTYGLGTENQNLPGFMVLCPGLSGARRRSCGPRHSCPPFTRARTCRTTSNDPEKLIQNIRNRQLEPATSGGSWTLLDKLNRSYLEQAGTQPQLEAAFSRWRSRSACRPKRRRFSTSARRAKPPARATAISDFGRGCLMALRLVERGVRMVQVYFGDGQPWDSHDDILVHRQAGAAGRPADRRAARRSESARAASTRRC